MPLPLIVIIILVAAGVLIIGIPLLLLLVQFLGFTGALFDFLGHPLFLLAAVAFGAYLFWRKQK